jgi:hypothetical protein
MGFKKRAYSAAIPSRPGHLEELTNALSEKSDLHVL